jgi:hypothetical protein
MLKAVTTMTMAKSWWKPCTSPAATRYTVEGRVKWKAAGWCSGTATASSRPVLTWGDPAQRKAAEITEQMSVTGSEASVTASEGTGEGVSDAVAADTDATGEVEETGPFRIYLGAAPGVGKTYAMLSEGQRRRARGTDVVAGFVESYGRPLTGKLINGLEVVPARWPNTGGAV